MSKSGTTSEHEKSIFKQASDALGASGFDGDYSSWEAANRLVKTVIEGMGFEWSLTSGEKEQFRMKLIKEMKNRGKTEKSSELLTLEISVHITLPSYDGFAFEIPDTELKQVDIEDNHFFIFGCVIENRHTYFMFPHQKILNEIEHGLPRNADDNGWKCTINMEEFTKRIEEIDDTVTTRKAFIMETRSNVTSYGNNFRFITDKMEDFPIMISRNLEELFMGDSLDEIAHEDVVALAELDELSAIIEKTVDEDQIDDRIETESKKIVKSAKRKSKKNKKS